MSDTLVHDFAQLRMTDVEMVGGKNASLGEMISQLSARGVRVPGGFATSAEAYRAFLQQDGLATRINDALGALDIEDVERLAEVGAQIRSWVVNTPFPAELEAQIRAAYEALCADDQSLSLAVRSSATAEDLPDASFAGQQESFLNIVGIDNVLHAIKEVFASLYNDRAIAYRVHQGFAHADVALSAGVQRMVRSDSGASGVMFTLDTESGFRDVVFITSSWGLGEMVVQGAVNPDEFYVHKPMLAQGNPAIVRRTLGSKLQKMIFSNTAEVGVSVQIEDVSPEDQARFSLSDDDLHELAQFACTIEAHYGRPMDIEWGRDGRDGKLYILQARPETVKSQEKTSQKVRYQLSEEGEIVGEGRAIGQKIGAGKVRLVADASQMGQVENGDILVTDMTDPNWEPVMKRAAAIVTNRGGRTCHAAIIARELGIPAVVGCGDITRKLQDGDYATVSCAQGDTGYIYRGKLDFQVTQEQSVELPDIPVKIMMNVGNPELAFGFAQLPHAGVGLARLEFIINNVIGIHPKAILAYPNIRPEIAEKIRKQSQGYASARDFFVDKLVEGVASIACAYWPERVIVRLSDFKSNEYRKLIGGEDYEPEEENPMLGFRGAARYISEDYAKSFEMETEAMRRVRDVMGFTNIELMVPFVRTLREAQGVTKLLQRSGLERGVNGLKLIMMCELPCNAVLADEFLAYFDGFSIGSNDMTQLTLGLDRDSGLVAEDFDERDPAVKAMLSMAIRAAKKQGKYVGICGQGPSDHPDLAAWLVEQGIDSLSLNPDTVVDTWQMIAELQGAAVQ